MVCQERLALDARRPEIYCSDSPLDPIPPVDKLRVEPLKIDMAA